jgi:hypothetical protein
MLIRVMILGLVSLISRVALASTIETTKVACKYINSSSELQVDAICSLTYGSSLPTGGFYRLEFPNGASANIVVSSSDTVATINNIPSQVVSAGKQVVAITEEGEVFVFQTP